MYILLTLVFMALVFLDLLKLKIHLMAIVCGIFAVFSLTFMLQCVSEVTNGMVIDERIAMYQEENNNIQNEITIIVENYQQYEKSTFEQLKNESPITLVNVYPELKANEVVNKQIDIYIENNRIIKQLKNNKINIKVARWWLYFGN